MFLVILATLLHILLICPRYMYHSKISYTELSYTTYNRCWFINHYPVPLTKTLPPWVENKKSPASCCRYQNHSNRQVLGPQKLKVVEAENQCYVVSLAGGNSNIFLKNVNPYFVEDFQFDEHIFFQMGGSTTDRCLCLKKKFPFPWGLIFR